MTLGNIPAGKYEVGVQTVDAALNGSKFKTGNFTVGGSGVNTVNVENSPVVAIEYYDIAGRRLNEAPVKGIVIKKNLRANGSVSVVKEIL